MVCEPYYAPVTYKTVLDGQKFAMPNKWMNANQKQCIANGLQLEEKDAELFKGAMGDLSS